MNDGKQVPAFLEALDNGTSWGTLDLRLPDGERHLFGHGEPIARWNIHDDAALRRILKNPEVETGDTYVEGGWDAGDSGLTALLQVLMTNYGQLREPGRFGSLLHSLAGLLPRPNGVAKSTSDVAFHYDIDGWLFRKFLDEDMQYSCAYFPREGMSLEQAQRAKLSLVRRKLRVRPGDSVLDIGCGWGGLALYLAEHDDITVTGLTLSREQLAVARKRAECRGLAKRVRFLLQDYREHVASYDRVVSVGMFEHVGQRNYRRFFRAVKSSLKPEGLALLHTIGRVAAPEECSEWVRRRIFPGSHLPSLSEVSRAVEDTRLATTDVEVLRLHYAKTLACWLARFRASREEIRHRLGERFCRMWEFYLASSEASFRLGDLVVFQIQLARDPLVAPLTRDYLFEGEASSAELVGKHAHADASSSASFSSGSLMA